MIPSPIERWVNEWANNNDIATDGDAQPPDEHDNTAHSETYAVDGDAQPPLGIQTGTYVSEDSTGLTGSGDESWGTSVIHSSSSITFPVTYDTPPRVFVEYDPRESSKYFGEIVTYVDSRSADSFTLFIVQYDTTDHAAAGEEIAVNWLAVGDM